VWAGCPRSQGFIPDRKKKVSSPVQSTPSSNGTHQPHFEIEYLGCFTWLKAAERDHPPPSIEAWNLSQIPHKFIMCPGMSFASGDFISASAYWKHFGPAAAK
jgi:hypothetical protein